MLLHLGPVARDAMVVEELPELGFEGVRSSGEGSPGLSEQETGRYEQEAREITCAGEGVLGPRSFDSQGRSPWIRREIRRRIVKRGQDRGLSDPRMPWDCGFRPESLTYWIPGTTRVIVSRASGL